MQLLIILFDGFNFGDAESYTVIHIITYLSPKEFFELHMNYIEDSSCKVIM